MKVLAGDLHTGARTVSGETIKDIIDRAEIIDSDVIPPRDKPHSAEGGTVVLFGNLAPDGAVVKQSAVAPDMRVFTGKARVMNSEKEALAAFDARTIQEDD